MIIIYSCCKVLMDQPHNAKFCARGIVLVSRASPSYIQYSLVQNMQHQTLTTLYHFIFTNRNNYYLNTRMHAVAKVYVHQLKDGCGSRDPWPQLAQWLPSCLPSDVSWCASFCTQPCQCSRRVSRVDHIQARILTKINIITQIYKFMITNCIRVIVSVS